MRCEPILQPVWQAILGHGAGVVDHWLFPATVGLVSFTVVCLGFTVKDLRRRATNKIVGDRWPSKRDIARAAVPQLVIYVGANALGWWAADQHIALPRQAPGLFTLLWQVVACFVVSDFLIYWEHRLMHAVPLLRRKVHSVHHKYLYPFSWAGGWVHPLEDAVVIVCVVTPTLLFSVHPLSFWVFVALWVACLIEEHSGYDVFWSPHRWLPFGWGGGGAPHDPHHNIHGSKNYGFVFAIWDQVFGTYMSVAEAAHRRARMHARGER
jgi:sterol desaturase/sphingolipid hydroxylase (fatty acid hydroxylase superfamily)